MKLIFEGKILIKFADADAQGLLFFARTFDLAHEALEEYWSKNPLGWAYWFKNPEFAVPLRHSSCEHLSPLHVGQTYSSRLSVLKISESSIQFQFEVCEQEKTCARVETVHVFVDRKSFKKISVPQAIRDLFS